MGKFKAWTEEEVAYLSAHWGRKQVSEIAKHLGRSEKGVREKEQNLRYPSSRRSWTRKEVEELKSLLSSGRYTCEDLCGKLQRSPKAIMFKIWDLNIKDRPLRGRFSPTVYEKWAKKNGKMLELSICEGNGYLELCELFQLEEYSLRRKVYAIYGTSSIKKIQRKLMGNM